MKAVIISSILLGIVTLGVILGIFAVSGRADSLIGLAETLDPAAPDMEDRFAALKDEWQNFEKAVAYLVDYRDIETVSSAFIDMENYRHSQNMADFFSAKEKFIHALDRIRKISRITPENIL